jgi:hypothetical protein
MNLVEFPFATLSRRPTLGSIECTRWVGDGRGGRQPQRWVVQGGSASGLPTEFDERVYVALMALTRAQGYAERRVSFSVYGVLRTMGEATDARHYRSVERSLERLLRVSIVGGRLLGRDAQGAGAPGQRLSPHRTLLAGLPRG